MEEEVEEEEEEEEEEGGGEEEEEAVLKYDHFSRGKQKPKYTVKLFSDLPPLS
jgi:hypothetical protein